LSEKGKAFFSPWKKKGFKEARVTTMKLDDLGRSTPLESNKSGTATGAKMAPSIITPKIMSIIKLLLE